ncbi:MAG: hypothetical protein A2921_02065 [Candidatus Magasanikbacteria bacterium RIFCSPLOWO2_01_FULL_43_20b]|uniref:Major facilitator superfamily (MFS) profile domain-containing protein n=1 Tax=Candidatus Magasanikbacteria bacterium RIFCSPLOWO2_12_FULL_43_12 TaxID=1798692 RepID=A0A1F6MQK5_9BACT|nr:MAG: hypothetical protein A3C74_02365 [Candidatus Magasanikbacteria bacterium RIFCSPHIGHO2_02_FULL_44_13]OGH73676.1 MAG: hypothetical protein A2921_02065 [Candidatus Magasanikbacteria bacterium RIFCSPLOWO2_01_FULL_43_20b]OGH73944.1 MAG: hypothetical protein A3G00_03495 [Candidatus Magasanikbacteria bacterium RIFCSPLOWO2_12_FULL_43_12]
MNEMYLSVFIMNLAESMISIFVPIYLFSLNYSVVSILLFFLIGYIGNVIFAIPIAKIVAKIGAKHAVLLSAPFLIAYYFGLRVLPEFSWLFFILPFGITGRALLYNFGFELNFLDHFDKKKVGGQLSTLAILSIMSTVLSPLIAGLIIAYFGYGVIFVIGSIILFISTLPLFVSNDCKHGLDFTLKDITKIFTTRKSANILLSFSGYAIESSIGRNIWPVFLIITFGAVQKVGYAAAIAAFLTVAVIAATGKLSDKYNTKKLLNFGTMFYFFSWLGCLLADTAFKTFIANSYRSVTERFLLLPWQSLLYKIVNRENYFRLTVLQDMTFNASRVLILPFIMLIFIINYYPYQISFIIAALFTLLYPLLNKAGNDDINNLPNP